MIHTTIGSVQKIRFCWKTKIKLPRRDEKSTQAVEKNKFPAPRILKKHVPGYQKNYGLAYLAYLAK